MSSKNKFQDLFEQYEKESGNKIPNKYKKELSGVVTKIVESNGKRKLRTYKKVNESNKKSDKTNKKEVIKESKDVDANKKADNINENKHDVVDTFLSFKKDIAQDELKNQMNESDMHKKDLEIRKYKRQLMVTEAVEGLSSAEKITVKTIMEAFEGVSTDEEYKTVLVSTVEDVAQNVSAQNTSLSFGINEGADITGSAIASADPMAIFDRL